MKTRIELAMSRALQSIIEFGMSIEMAARSYGVTESALISEMEIISGDEVFEDHHYTAAA